jgi:hypothetical protein
LVGWTTFWGRAAALGEPDAAVVVATFAVFELGLVRATYDQARRACPRDRLIAGAFPPDVYKRAAG